MTEVARYTQLILPVFWFGMVVAISFLEAPIKFRAPGVTLAIGLGIGRKVFLASMRWNWFWHSRCWRRASARPRTQPC